MSCEKSLFYKTVKTVEKSPLATFYRRYCSVVYSFKGIILITASGLQTVLELEKKLTTDGGFSIETIVHVHEVDGAILAVFFMRFSQ